MNPFISELLENEIFSQSRAEIEFLGFKLSPSPIPGSRPYAVIGGRSNARWWLVPLENGRLVNSGLELFQPVIPSAKILKNGALLATSLGLSRLWARKVLHIAGKSSLADIFSDNDLRYAFFTGTDSPHRKSAIQVMDRNGVLKGFAKVTRNPAIESLLHHEAEMLGHLHTLNLRKALLPRVIYCGELGGANVLVTDTLKTNRTKTSTSLNSLHVGFLRELKEKTSMPGSRGSDRFVAELRRQYDAVADKLPPEWQQRLERALAVLAGHNEELGSCCLSHGDFTPWNTFFVGDRLYVFDWEYARQGYPPGYDLIHFLLSIPKYDQLPVKTLIEPLKGQLQSMKVATCDAGAEVLILCYLCGHSLQRICRELEMCNTLTQWDGEQEQAILFDALI